jgi:hypothetical protein
MDTLIALNSLSGLLPELLAARSSQLLTTLNPSRPPAATALPPPLRKSMSNSTLLTSTEMDASAEMKPLHSLSEFSN